MEEQLNNMWIELNDSLKSFILKQVKDSHIADDILQDVFLKVNSKIDTLKDETKISSWIFQITRNSIHDHFRSKKNFKTEDFDFEISDTEITENETQKLSRCIKPMIDALPEKYKEAVRLSEIEGLSQKDMADQLNISYSGIKSRVQRGREKLKELLLDCCIIHADKYGNIIEQKEKLCSGKC